ncbi:MAG: hypothetical protein ABSD21_00330 [Rhizomicrobium sp.]
MRPEVIRCLLTGARWTKGQEPWPLYPGGLEIAHARIDGNLDLEGCELLVPLWMAVCGIGGALVLKDAKTQSLGFNSSHVSSIDAHRARIEGSLHLRNEFQANGEVNLSDANISGHLSCLGGRFENNGKLALNGNALTVGADVFLSDFVDGSDSKRFHAVGEVNLVGAKIGGQLNCKGGRFENKDKIALDCDTLTVGASVFLNDGFYASGEVNLARANIGGQLFCVRGRFENKDKIALNCAALTVGADVILHDKFYASGEVNFYRTTMGGNLRCDGSIFDNEGKTALRLDSAKIGMGLYLIGVEPIKGNLNLLQAEARSLHDDSSAWPKPGNIKLDGFTYQRFLESKTDWKTRLDWLKRQPPSHLSDDFRPQPWAQLIKVLREMGHERDAHQIAIEREKAMARRPTNSRGQKLWDWLRGITVGYGYRPSYAMYWSIGFFLVGWLTFATAGNFGYMAPRDGSVIAYMAANPRAPLPPRYTEFNSLIYAFDAYLPVIELGQDSAWEPSAVPMRGSLRPINDGSIAYWFAERAVSAFSWGVHRIVYWADEVLGWIFVSLYIAGMSGIMKKE